MKLESLINDIESRISKLEAEDNSITDTILKTQELLSTTINNNNKYNHTLKEQLSTYIIDYSQSYFYKMRDPEYYALIKMDDHKKSAYVAISKQFVWLAAYGASIFLANTLIMPPNNIGEFFTNIIASLGIASIMEYVESQKKYFAREVLGMPGREEVFGSSDYNKKLRKTLVQNLSSEVIDI